MSDRRRQNRLAEETSPYLLQHANNPVDWYPWGAEALARARAEDKPILLSIGYSACHWCHVMERESFEDEETAALLNQRFVSIKVDREERPDLDAIYMDAVTGMTGHGGWPLTVFLTPQGEPFYGGTYFPKEESFGVPAFRAVLNGISAVWRDRREEARSSAGRIRGALGRAGEMAGSTEPLTEELSWEASTRLRTAFDPRWGGFGGAPKFPQPTTLEFLLRRQLRQRSDGGSDEEEGRNAVDMLTTTLDAMAAGGIYDHVGGGFHRYSTDAAWHVPHFEKMLYDNAQLARLYVRAWQATDRSAYVRVASETLDYLLREMQHPEGGFFSSQDADSEGVEGKYFAWPWDELVRAVGEDVAICLGASPEGNWEGTNVLWRPFPVAAVADEREVPVERLEREVEEGRRRLFELRGERVPPATDDKVLASWNAMAVSALAEGGRVFGSAEYVEAAVKGAGFVLTHLRDDHGRLLRSWRNGRSGGLGYADDHALMADACLALYETTFELRWFTAARELCDELLRLFHDSERGGFFATGSDAEELLIRPKDLYDNAVPSGNSAAADVLLRMALLTGEAGYEHAAVSALRLVRDAMAGAPSGFGHALCALDLYLGPAQEVAIVGDPTATETRALIDEVLVKRFLPNHVLAVATPDDAEAMRAVPLLRNRDALGGRATAYVCERFACKAPVTDLNELAAQLV